MHIYQVAIPVNIDRLFSYTSQDAIPRGSRVLVSFSNSMRTGIVWGEQKTAEPAIKYKQILEIIDTHALLSEEQLKLASWMAKYYCTPVGKVLFAMLPTGLSIELQQTVTRLAKEIPASCQEHEKTLLKEMKPGADMQITSLKDAAKIPEFYFWLERLEAQKLIDIERVYDAKIKKKVRNYVVKLPVDERPKLNETQQELYDYIAELEEEFPLADIAKEFSYARVKGLREKGLIRIEPREERPQSILSPVTIEPREITLTDEQTLVIEQLKAQVDEGKFGTNLLYGVTGSGKTEVYIELIRHCRSQNKTALMLIPEISLTPQMVARFRCAFEEEIAILHSHLNDRERYEQWQMIHGGSCGIVIGARSAVFAPLNNIGVILIDEEHEGSYKQENSPRYSARDVAIVRARQTDAVVVLGSATPSLETWHNALDGKYRMLKLTQRPVARPMPDVNIIDMRSAEADNRILSDELMHQIEQRMKRKEQVILLHNRRGHASFVQCVQCGTLYECPQCAVSLTYHSYQKELHCHYCGFHMPEPRQCKNCNSFLFVYGAAGTQQIEKQLKLLFPSARILRMDSDTTTKKDSYDVMYQRMKEGTVDILLGTQMIAKGLDFSGVTLVGVISADIGLNFPDFRAAERTYQLLTQVAGRSGRGEKPGEVIIQTYNPEHYAIRLAVRQDYASFAIEEMSLRKGLFYPPYSRIGRMIFSHKQEQYLQRELKKFDIQTDYLRRVYAPEELTLLGPTPTPLTKLQNMFRYHLIIKAENASILSAVMNHLQKEVSLPSGIKVAIDIDPLSLM